MQATRRPQATMRTTSFLQKFPRQHLFAAVASIALIVSSLFLISDDNQEDSRVTSPVALNIPVIDPLVTEEVTTDIIPEEPLVVWQEIKVQPGDSLSDIFKRAHLSARDMMNILNSGDEGKRLTRIFPGQLISYAINDEGDLVGLKHHVSALESTEFTLDADTINAQNIVLTPDVFEHYKSATIESSLFLAGQRAGLSQNQVMEIASIFSGVIDFVLDPREGDQFSVLFEQQYLNGEYIGDGNILAAQYIGEDGNYTAYRYTDVQGNVGYYSPEGISMRKAFLRAPLDFTRISSNFDMRRQHPIHKMIKAHRGIDYAAPRGTPIYAAGDGRVIKSGYSKPNGNYVFIQHGEQYVTKYIHLDKRSVKTGERVKQKQVIGTVGSTGYATGPHLHYEFLVNGVHRNPRTIIDKLPKAKSLDKGELARFTNQTQPLAQQFAAFQQRFALASSVAGTGE